MASKLNTQIIWRMSAERNCKSCAIALDQSIVTELASIKLHTIVVVRFEYICKFYLHQSRAEKLICLISSNEIQMEIWTCNFTFVVNYINCENDGFSQAKVFLEVA